MKVHAVVVTYRPGPVGPLIRALAAQCAHVTVVDNTPGGDEELAAVCTGAGAELVELGDNMGIAAAHNIGISAALENGADAVLLSDQDSIIPAGMVETLVSHLDRGVGAVGPVPVEGTDELVYTDHRWGPKRAPLPAGAQEIEVSFLLASGCLIERTVLEDVGLMNAALFIDHVDLEWGMRARRAGYRLIAIPTAVLEHSLGDSVVKVPGRDQVVHIHSPIRNYYLIRNTLALIKTDLLPRQWRVRYVYWITRFSIFNVLINADRRERARYVVRGFIDGVTGRMGRYGR
ncbi:rhamnosyltransferase [Flaviflexus huanghaiensis]|uniref:rhamnosyltransferase n=1 Tax=Flaviflexus huanghaiensis TaxID=1111473 RepID=UPI0015FAAF2F